MTSDRALDNPFWIFSTALYADNDLAATCIRLQDADGVDVDILLLCVWLGTARKRLGSAQLDSLRDHVASWHDGVVKPLRQARRHLKTVDGGQTAFRAQVQALELEAERSEHAHLFAHASQIDCEQLGTIEDTIEANIALYLDALHVADAAHQTAHLLERVRAASGALPR